MKPEVKKELEAIERQARQGGGAITSYDFCLLITNLHLIRAIDALDEKYEVNKHDEQIDESSVRPCSSSWGAQTHQSGNCDCSAHSRLLKRSAFGEGWTAKAGNRTLSEAANSVHTALCRAVEGKLGFRFWRIE